MHLSHLYSSIMRGQWAIDLRDVDSSHQILAKVINGSFDKSSEEILSDRKPFEGQAFSKEMSRRTSFADELPADTVAIIPVHGTMMKYGTYCAYGTTEIADMIYEASNNPNITGIVLDMDSGGGCVDAIAPLTAAVEYARKNNKSTIAYCDLCASANYYTAIYCDEIIASNTISSEFGSIGVMMSFPDYAKYYEQAGIKIHTVYSDLSNYKNAPFEAAKQGKYDLIKREELNPLAQRFQDDVAARRGDKLDKSVEGILAGRMFYASDALKYGLIDAIGDKQYAINRAREISRDNAVSAYLQTKNIK